MQRDNDPQKWRLVRDYVRENEGCCVILILKYEGWLVRDADRQNEG